MTTVSLEPKTADTLFDLDVLMSEPACVYHDRAGEYLSSHMLLDFMACPLLYRKKVTGQIPDRDTDAYGLGRAIHIRVLEGVAVYEKTYAIGGPINEKTGKPFGPTTKAFAQWAAKESRPVLTLDEAEMVENVSAGVLRNDTAIELLQHGQAEGVVRTEYLSHPCQIRIDWLNPQRGIVDLKTCRDLDYFERDARKFRYFHQLAFYRQILAQALEIPAQDVPVYIIAAEKAEPFRCGVWLLSGDSLDFAATDIKAGILRLQECVATETWPTDYEQPRLLELYPQHF